ncbi:hypothetical protein Tco_0665441 [Tanacetum coccineum]
MSRTNSQAEIVSKVQLVPRANRLVIKKNNQRVASDSHIIDTMLRFMPPPDPNNTYIKPLSEIQILEFIKTLGYEEDPETKMIFVSKIIATRLHQPWRAILSVLNRCIMGKDSSWDTDEFKWQTVKRSSRPSKMSKLLYTRFTKLIIDYLLSLNKSIPCRSDSKLHSSQDDHPINKLLFITNSEYKFGMEVPDAMIKQHVSPIKSGRGKGFICYGDQVANIPNKLKKDVVPRKTRSLTITEETVVGKLANSISIQEPRSQQRQRIQLTIDILTDEAVADMYNEYSASDATLYSSSSNKSANETDDADESDMDLSHDNPQEDDDDARYGVFMHNKSTATPNSTYLSLTVTSSSLDFIQTLLDETPANELTNFMSHQVYTNAQTTSVVYNPEGNPELTSYTSGASEVPLAFENAVQAKVLTEIKKLLPTHILNAIANYVKPRLNTFVLEVMKTNQINLFTQSSTSTDDLLEMDLKLKLLNQTYLNKSNDTHTTHQQLYDTLYDPSFSIKMHSMLNHPFTKVEDDTPAMKPLDKADTLIQKHSNPEWFPKKSGLAKRNTTWFDLFLKSNIDKDENHILRPSTVAIAKKFKELIQKDVLTIADFKGAGLERLKWNSDEGDVSKPISLEPHMSKSTKAHPCFYNNNYTYLVDLSTEEKHTTSITKHYAARYCKEGTEERVPERWSKEVRRYHFEALNGIHHWDDKRIDFFKAGMSAVTERNVFLVLRIKSVIHIDVKKKWGYGFLTSIVVKRFDDKEYEFSYADLPRLSVNDVEDMYLLQVQDKLRHLPLEFVKDFNNSLLMFIRRTVIKNRVEDI